MLGWVIFEIVLGAVLGVALLGLYLWAKSWRTWTGRQLIAAAVGFLLEMISLLALAVGHPLPDWGYLVVFGITDLVVAGWVALFWSASRSASRQRS